MLAASWDMTMNDFCLELFSNAIEKLKDVQLEERVVRSVEVEGAEKEGAEKKSREFRVADGAPGGPVAGSGFRGEREGSEGLVETNTGVTLLVGQAHVVTTAMLPPQDRDPHTGYPVSDDELPGFSQGEHITPGMSGTPINMEPFQPSPSVSAQNPVVFTTPDKWPWEEMGASPIQNPEDRRNPSSDFQQRVDMAKKIADCPDCRKAKKHAYSDAATPGFFYTECEKHRQPGIQSAAGVVIEQEMPIEEAKKRFPDRAEELELKRHKAHGVEVKIDDQPRLKAALKSRRQTTKTEQAIGKPVNSPEDIPKILPPMTAPRMAHAPGCKCLICQPPKDSK